MSIYFVTLIALAIGTTAYAWYCAHGWATNPADPYDAGVGLLVSGIILVVAWLGWGFTVGYHVILLVSRMR